jgi:hypothetical protein
MPTLEELSKLCGDASFRVRGEDKDSVHPVMTTDEIRRMPSKCALLIRGDLSPVVVHLPMAWSTREIRAANRSWPRGIELPPARAPRPMFSLMPVSQDGPEDPELTTSYGLDLEHGDADEAGPWTSRRTA